MGCTAAGSDAVDADESFLEEKGKPTAPATREWARCWFDTAGEDVTMSCTTAARGESALAVKATITTSVDNLGFLDPEPFESVDIDDAEPATVVVGKGTTASFPLHVSISGFAQFIRGTAKLAFVEDPSIGPSNTEDILVTSPTEHDAEHPIIFSSAALTFWPAVFHYADGAEISAATTYYDALRAAKITASVGGSGLDGNAPKEGEPVWLLAPPSGSIELDLHAGGQFSKASLDGAGTYRVSRQGVTRQ